MATEAYLRAAEQAMYGATNEYSEYIPYVTGLHAPMEDDLHATLHEQHGWHDGTPMAGGPGIHPQTAEAFGAWGHGEVFVPQPRSPVTGTGTPPVRGSRRRTAPPRAMSWSQILGSVFGLLTAVAVTAVCLVGWMLSYHPLRDLAFSRVPQGLSQLWPIIIYGPWLAGCLSVLRAALDGRRVVHSWVVVVVFSTVATVLCVADVSQALPDMVVAGLPPITSAISLHQLVRQLGGNRDARRPAARPTSHKARR
ncbi:DUF2637 domain-containing protein [Kitasatospora sp. NBC_00374]|uniref:DUF2637 domain-containing protein n=1 Tax=Kitasatospora sp. NBC_00374 TaxID=2975964 RepID=UPI0030DEAA26